MSEVSQVLSGIEESVFPDLAKRLQKSQEELSWRPGPGWNSQAVLIKHILASMERFIGKGVLDLEGTYLDHDTQFSDADTDVATMSERVRDVEQKLRDWLTGLDPELLAEPSPIAVGGKPRTRGQVLLLALTHASWHVGQMRLMDRLWRERA